MASHAGISDENDFQAVSSRETIELDKVRMAQNRAAYQQVQPTANPERTGASEAAVDLVQYALKAPNRMGEAIYPRSKIALANSQKSCARYASPRRRSRRSCLPAGRSATRRTSILTATASPATGIRRRSRT